MKFPLLQPPPGVGPVYPSLFTRKAQLGPRSECGQTSHSSASDGSVCFT